ncbi:MAG TPA: formylglycine-generating enzyme family protein [Alphaproteobacteria bacterium]|nr:formylglycine-generating enzyme family protein [Alphaproteobacteria bacterium]
MRSTVISIKHALLKGLIVALLPGLSASTLAQDELVFANGFEQIFFDCTDCPIMVQIPAGAFMQGSPPDEPERVGNEGPQRTVNVPAFAMSQTEVTFEQWDACVVDSGCSHVPSDTWGRGDQPVTDVSWNHAQEYITWLSARTSEDYRLPSESEWEYATRAGTTSRFHTGDCITTDQANFYGPNPAQSCPAGEFRGWTLPVASFAPNAFGLYGTHDNVREWVQDCWNSSYTGAPTDGNAWMTGDCSDAVLRGGSWFDFGRDLRSARRLRADREFRSDFYVGFRVARAVTL